MAMAGCWRRNPKEVGYSGMRREVRQGAATSTWGWWPTIEKREGDRLGGVTRRWWRDVEARLGFYPVRALLAMNKVRITNRETRRGKMAAALAVVAEHCGGSTEKTMVACMEVCDEGNPA
ncbi:hypothetical protein L1987_06758 [Smallanthus sonchifolius]|uniref:Uncharacterized protein n=1 Tax=Smallanthus sonchifolius TaxID=185202 RepID=A0ACB9JZ42_9ASTR|nr:hypothetical protein L1987_06758 [Smallanthus sonchifolius]